MSVANVDGSDSAQALYAWFQSVLQECDAIFALTTSPAHREVVIQSVLTSNAKIVVDSVLDRDGALYPALCKLLAAAVRKLSLELSGAHWKAALQNVASVYSQRKSRRTEVGLDFGSPAAIFKGLLAEALINAGVTDRPTILIDENRTAALGLAINWGIRFLLAYAAELPVRPRKRAQRAHDIWWIRTVLVPLLPK